MISTRRPRRDGLAAELLRCDVPDGLGEPPPMARQVLDGALALAVLAVRGRFDHAGTVRACALVLCTDVLDPHSNEVRHRPVMLRRLATELRDDHCSVGTDAHLGTVSLAYPRALDEAERRAQPRHCLSHIRVGEDGHDGGRRDRPIGLHAPDPARPHPSTGGPSDWVFRGCPQARWARVAELGIAGLGFP